jgi:hypothetical protein
LGECFGLMVHDRLGHGALGTAHLVELALLDADAGLGEEAQDGLHSTG